MKKDLKKIEKFEKYGVIKSAADYFDENRQEKEFLDLVVFGHYSGGKTSFLNAFFGIGKNKKLLPVGRKPTTNKNWKISYGINEMIKCYDSNNKIIKQLTLSKVKELEEEYVLNIDHFNVEVLSPLLKENNVLIWDTPGLNDETFSNSDETKELIKKSEVAILVGSRDKIMSSSTKNFLESVKSLHAKFLIIVTNAEQHESFVAQKESYKKNIDEFIESIFPADNMPEIFLADSKEVTKQFKSFFAGNMDDKDLFDMISVLEENGWRDIYKKIIELIENSRAIIDERLENKLNSNSKKTIIEIDNQIKNRKDKIKNKKELIKIEQKKEINLKYKKLIYRGDFQIKDTINYIYTKKEEIKQEKKGIFSIIFTSHHKKLKNKLISEELKIKNRVIRETNEYLKKLFEKKLNSISKENIIKFESDKKLLKLFDNINLFSNVWKQLIKQIDKKFIESDETFFIDYFSKLIDLIDFDFLFKKMNEQIKKNVQKKVTKHNNKIREEVERIESNINNLNKELEELNNDKKILK